MILCNFKNLAYSCECCAMFGCQKLKLCRSLKFCEERKKLKTYTCLIQHVFLLFQSQPVYVTNILSQFFSYSMETKVIAQKKNLRKIVR